MEGYTYNVLMILVIILSTMYCCILIISWNDKTSLKRIVTIVFCVVLVIINLVLHNLLLVIMWSISCALSLFMLIRTYFADKKRIAREQRAMESDVSPFSDRNDIDLPCTINQSGKPTRKLKD